MPTVKDALDRANPNDLPNQLARLRDKNATGENLIADADAVADRATQGLGALLASLRPRTRTRTGLTSLAAHVHDVASTLTAVQAVAGTPLAIISGAAPGAGEVRIEYDAVTGVPTITFAAATTTYLTHETGPLPQNLAAVMATLT